MEGGCLCVFFIPARHGAERTRSGAFLPPRRDAVSSSLFLFLFSTPFCRVDLYSNLSRQSRKRKKGATFYIRTGSCYVYIVLHFSPFGYFFGSVAMETEGKQNASASFRPLQIPMDHIRYLFVDSHNLFFEFLFSSLVSRLVGWAFLLLTFKHFGAITFRPAVNSR